jgi:predicted dehydrogenase
MIQYGYSLGRTAQLWIEGDGAHGAALLQIGVRLGGVFQRVSGLDVWHEVPGALTSLQGAPAFNVGRAYAAFAADIDQRTHSVPDFADAVRRHEVIAAIERSAAAAERVTA